MEFYFKMLVLLAMFVVPVVTAETCHDPVAEGSILSLYKYYQNIHGLFQWKVESNSAFGEILVSECNPNLTILTCTSFFEDSYKSTIQYENGKYRVTLTIHDVTKDRDGRTWRWYDGSGLLGDCNLVVYDFRSSPVCNTAEISSTGSAVAWTCDVNDVYPSISCRFEYKKESDENYKTVPQNHIGSSKKDSDMPGYYNEKCSLNLPISAQMIGVYTFRFTAIMDLRNMGFEKLVDKTAFSNKLNLYIPVVTSFNANSEQSVLEVNEADKVSFKCNAEGMPKPRTLVQVQRSGDYITLEEKSTGEYIKTSSFGVRVMGCLDTGLFTCTASNVIGISKSIEISVFVRCAPKLPILQNLIPKDYQGKQGQDLEIRIPVIGYPKPASYTLIMNDHGGSRKKRHAIKVLTEDYDVTYIPGILPEGDVALKMLKLAEESKGSYVFHIYNGIGLGLEVNFNVVITNSDNSDDDDELNAAEIVGIVIGVVVGTGICVTIGCYCFCRCEC